MEFNDCWFRGDDSPSGRIRLSAEPCAEPCAEREENFDMLRAVQVRGGCDRCVANQIESKCEMLASHWLNEILVTHSQSTSSIETNTAGHLVSASKWTRVSGHRVFASTQWTQHCWTLFVKNAVNFVRKRFLCLLLFREIENNVVSRIIMNCVGILTKFSRLSLHIFHSTTRNISTDVNPLCFGATNVLLAEPIKKKKRIDPAIIRQREEKRKKKLEKQIRRLEKNARQLKPIADVDIPFKLIDEREQRLRNLPAISPEVEEARILLEKDWARYKLRERVADIQMIDNICYSQQRALDELRAESEELYREAIQIDLRLIPCTVKGPSRTPAIQNYDSPDGDYLDVTKKFEGED